MDSPPLVRAGKKLNDLELRNAFAALPTLFLPMLKTRISNDIANSLKFQCLGFGSVMKSVNWKYKN